MNKQPSWMSKVTGLKIKKEQLLMILFVGLLLVVIAMPTSKEKKNKTKKSNTPTEYSNYEDATEKRLATALEKVQGVGAVEVMVTLKTSAERIVEKDEEKDENTRKENTIYDSTGSGIQT
ncbi:MAG: stage III sporulation protein AG, partial [Lachnospiraceae bacterium]